MAVRPMTPAASPGLLRWAFASAIPVRPIATPTARTLFRMEAPMAANLAGRRQFGGRRWYADSRGNVLAILEAPAFRRPHVAVVVSSAVHHAARLAALGDVDGDEVLASPGALGRRIDDHVGQVVTRIGRSATVRLGAQRELGKGGASGRLAEDAVRHEELGVGVAIARVRVHRIGVAGHQLLDLHVIGRAEGSPGSLLLPPRRSPEGRRRDDDHRTYEPAFRIRVPHSASRLNRGHTAPQRARPSASYTASASTFDAERGGRPRFTAPPVA